MQLGFFFWKLAADKLPKFNEVSVKTSIGSLLTNSKWLIGTAATTVGWVLFVKAMDLGDISVVQPIMSTGAVIIVLLGRFRCWANECYLMNGWVWHLRFVAPSRWRPQLRPPS